MNNTKTFRMPVVNYYVRKTFRPKVLVLDFDDTVCLWPRNLKLANGKHLNFSAYIGNIFAKFISEILDIDRDDAHELCLSSFLEYGSVIIGLLESKDYDVTPEQARDIFKKCHLQMANNPSKGLIAWAKPNFALIHQLAQIKTTPYIFTHGSTEYAKIGIKLMGLDKIIPEENIIGMEQYGHYNTKNKPNAYIWLQQKLGLPFNRMIMSEDSHKNLVYAKELGMKTVLLHKPAQKGEPFPDYPYVDHTHQTLEDYLQMFLQKGVNYTEEKLDRSVEESVWENQTSGSTRFYRRY